MKSRKAKIFNHRLRVYSDITQLVAAPENPTPLVKLNRIVPKLKNFELHIKLERFNPFGSIKDRIVREMLKGIADKVKNKIIIEPSSGNTGLALAAMANALGIETEIAVPKGIPEEKKTFLKLLGVKLQEAEDNLCPLFPNEGARGLVKALVESPATRDKYLCLNQYENELNPFTHYKTTGPEIWKQTKGSITHFFAGFGTAGTISGIGKYLKEQNSEIKVIGIEPKSSNHKLAGMKRISDLPKELIPKIIDKSVIDETIDVSDKDAYETAILLARKEGILGGPTTGAILYAALKWTEKSKGIGVVISPDDAFKYASFFQQFLKEKEEENKEIKEYDLRSFYCPLSKIKAIEIVKKISKGERVKILLGDGESLQNVAGELKSRKIKFKFKEEGENLFSLTIKK